MVHTLSYFFSLTSFDVQCYFYWRKDKKKKKKKALKVYIHKVYICINKPIELRSGGRQKSSRGPLRMAPEPHFRHPWFIVCVKTKHKSFWIAFISFINKSIKNQMSSSSHFFSIFFSNQLQVKKRKKKKRKRSSFLLTDRLFDTMSFLRVQLSLKEAVSSETAMNPHHSLCRYDKRGTTPPLSVFVNTTNKTHTQTHTASCTWPSGSL